MVMRYSDKNKTVEQEEQERSIASRESLYGGNATAQILLNGLVRAARNQLGVGADGNPDRYQQGAHDGA